MKNYGRNGEQNYYENLDSLPKRLFSSGCSNDDWGYASKEREQGIREEEDKVRFLKDKHDVHERSEKV